MVSVECGTSDLLRLRGAHGKPLAELFVKGIMELDPEEIRPLVNRLKRAHGQLGGVVRMIEEGQECADVVTQLAAVKRALNRAGIGLITHSIRHTLESDEECDMDTEKLEKVFLTLA